MIRGADVWVLMWGSSVVDVFDSEESVAIYREKYPPENDARDNYSVIHTIVKRYEG